MSETVVRRYGIYKLKALLSVLLLLLTYHYASSQNWQPLGPFYTPALINPKDYSIKMANGVGRVGPLIISRSNSELTLLLGTPYGGLWKSLNNGQSWDSVETGIANSGVGAVVVDPKNNNHWLIVSGDADCMLDKNQPALGSESCQSRGIYESYDSGKTWSATPIGNWYDENGELQADFWKFPSLKAVKKLIIDPKKSAIMYVVLYTYNNKTSSYDGFVYKTTDAGKNWNVSLKVTDGYFRDLEMHSYNNKILFAGGKALYRTVNAGKSWKRAGEENLTPDTNTLRVEIAVNKNTPDFIIALCVNNKTKRNDIFRSIDGGISFSNAGFAGRSPEWRTALAIDPNDTSRIYLSSANKLAAFTFNGKEYKQTAIASNVHDDLHEIAVDELTGDVYASCDGGLFRSSDKGKTWTDLNNKLNIAECWGISNPLSKHSEERPLRKLLVGLQDCGTVLYDTSEGQMKWTTVRGGDGMKTAFSVDNDKVVYHNDGNNKLLTRSEDGGYAWSKNLAPSGQAGAYLRPFAVNPFGGNTIYTAFTDFYISENKGEKWENLTATKISNKSDKAIAIAVSPVDTNVFYLGFEGPCWNENASNKLFMTNNHGQSWKDVSAGLNGVKWWELKALTCSAKFPAEIYAGFRAASPFKVMYSDGFGLNGWKDISSGIPADCDVNCLITDVQSGFIYAGTHNGVYVLTDKNSSWKKVGSNLPIVMVSDLSIRYDTNELYAGTHGRGVWVISLK